MQFRYKYCSKISNEFKVSSDLSNKWTTKMTIILV